MSASRKFPRPKLDPFPKLTVEQREEALIMVRQWLDHGPAPSNLHLSRADGSVRVKLEVFGGTGGVLEHLVAVEEGRIVLEDRRGGP